MQKTNLALANWILFDLVHFNVELETDVSLVEHWLQYLFLPRNHVSARSFSVAHIPDQVEVTKYTIVNFTRIQETDCNVRSSVQKFAKQS